MSPKRSTPEDLNDTLDRIIDWPKTLPMSAIRDVDLGKVEDALMALQKLERLQTELVFTGKYRR